MNFVKRLAIGLSAAAIAVLGISAPAQAVGPTLGCGMGGSSSTNAYGQVGTTYTYTIISVCNRITVNSLSGTLTYNGTTYTSGTTNATFTVVAGQDLTLVAAAGTTDIVLTQSPNFTSLPGWAAQITLTASGGGGGGSSSSATTTPHTLSLEVAASGASCTSGNPSGVSGSWLTLPGADTCSQSGPTAKAAATLLGWSTSANFPIARAQAQIDKHWGVIDEVIDGTRMIFIPGGMAVFVSGPNNLYPVWSK